MNPGRRLGEVERRGATRSTGSDSSGICESRQRALKDHSVEDWPATAITVALRNGNASVWQCVTAAINRDPFGSTAHQVEEMLRSADVRRSIGAIAEVLADARARLEAAEQLEVTRVVHALLKRSRLSQHEFATRIGVSGAELGAYIEGRACPTATLLIRMRRLAERFERASAQRRT